MALSIAHVSTVHSRRDTRIFFRELRSIRKGVRGRVVFYVRDGRGREVVDGIEIVDLGQPSVRRLERSVLGSLQVVWAVLRGRHDIVHFHDPELLLAMAVVRLFGTRVVFDVHELVAEDIRTKRWIPGPLRWATALAYSLVEKSVIWAFDLVLAEESYQRRYGLRGVVVRNFPDVSLVAGCRGSGDTKYERFTLCYMGSISLSRGVGLYVEAASLLRGEGYEVDLVLVGPIPTDLEESGLLNAGRVEGWLRTTGRLDPISAWTCAARCHVGLAVLDPEGNFVESYPTKLFEYMALGLPVVVSDFPLYRKVVQDVGCGLLVEPGRVEQLLAAIVLLIGNSSVYEAMSHAGRSVVSSMFQWSPEADKLISLYARGLPESALRDFEGAGQA